MPVVAILLPQRINKAAVALEVLDLLVHRLPLIDGERSFLVDNLRKQSLEHWFYDVGQRDLSELDDLVDALDYGEP